MIVARAGTRVFLGLTDVNIGRLQDARPIRIREHLPGLEVATAEEIIIFHATRETCVELARTVGFDEKVLLDALGEG